jgi:ABC-type nitrate/sulfonate/bicarbonate transport system substrate-binding protein
VNLDPASTRRQFIRRSSLTLGGVALLGAAGQFLTACGGDDDDSASTPPRGPGAGAATTAAPGTSAAGATAEVRTAFSWIPAAEWGNWYLGDSNGYFAANGIKSTLIHGGPNTPAVSQIVASGDAEIGLAADELEVIKANAEGSDYVILAASYQRSPFGYTWLASTPISGPADIVGKRIGGVQGDQIRIDAIFKINGLPVDYEFVPMSYDPQPLVDGEMDIITSYVTNQPIALGMKGVETKTATFSDWGFTTYGDVIFAPRAWVAENRDVAVRYFKALIKGADDNLADPAAAIPVMMSTYGKDAELDEAFETKANVEYVKLMESDYTKANGLLAIDPDFVKDKVYAAYTAAGETNLPDVSKLLDLTVALDARK